jgi:protein TonB
MLNKIKNLSIMYRRLKGFLMKKYLLLLILSFATISFCSLPVDDEYSIAADEFPNPVGGMAAIDKFIVYPAIAQQSGVHGKVYVLAYINEKGNVDDVKLVKGIGAGCDEAVIAAIKKSKFIPGKIKGVNVKTKLTIPITFKMK